jgi:ribosomal protein S27E
MILVRCDSCGKTVECPDGYKPDDWRQRTDAKTRQVFHSCSVQCRGTGDDLAATTE